MNPFTLLDPARWLLYGAFVGALALGAWRIHHVIDAQGYERAQAECALATNKANALAQARHDEQAANAAAAFAGYENARLAWEQTQKEHQHALYIASENLASCRLNGATVRLLNDARRAQAHEP